jgi:predicted nuclease of predicted toxin-antitoxin system
VKFLVDEQLPEGVAQWLVDQGHDAEHVRAIRMKSASDRTIWDHALATGSVIVTKDRDFVEWSMTRTPIAIVLWLRFGNLKRSVLLERMASVWPRTLAHLEAGAAVVEAGP